MPRKILLALFFMLAVRTAGAHGSFAFTNGKWFDGTQFVSKTMYSVEGTLRERYDGKVNGTIDLAGRYIVPPFADDHNHVFGDADNIDNEVRRYRKAGIFYVKNPNSTAKLSAPMRARMNTPETVDVAYSFGGITASGGHPIQIYDSVAKQGGFPGWTAADMRNQAYYVVDTPADLDRVWPLIEENHPDFIKTYLDHSEDFEARKDDPAFYGRKGLDPAMLKRIVARAHAAGLRVTTHITTAADFRNAIEAGSDEIAHFPLEALTAEDALLAARHHVTVVTTLLSHRPTSGVADLTALYRLNLQLLKAAGVNVVIGVDQGEKTAIDEAEAVRGLGVFSPVELLRMWTGATARAVFPGRKIGSLRDGYEASFLALDGNPLVDFSAVRRVVVRVKTGHLVEIAPDKPLISEALLPIVHDKGVEAAIAEYRRLLAEKPALFDYGEAAVNKLGYSLLTEKRIADAVAILLFNTELHPKSANVWDSLGEAYGAAGDHDRAVENYRKSLALNPHNANALEMLRKLGVSPQ